MEPTSTRASKSMFINTCGCGAGFPWLLAHTTPTCTLGPPAAPWDGYGDDIYTPLRYWNTSTWVPYGCVHLHVHPDTDLNTYHGAVAATGRWRHYYGSGRPLLHQWLNLRRWSAHCRGPAQYLAPCVHRRQLWLPTVYDAGLRLVRLAALGTPCFRPE